MAEDPTHSKTKRDRHERLYRKRWRTVRGEIRKELSSDSYYRPQNDVDPSRQEADFREFLEGLIQREVIEPESQRRVRNGGHYSANQVDELYEHGIRQALLGLNRAGYDVPDISASDLARTESHRRMRQAARLEVYQDLEDASRAAIQEATREYRNAVREGASVKATTDAVNDRVDKVGRYRTNLVAQSKSIGTINNAALRTYLDANIEEVGPVPELRRGEVTVDGTPTPMDEDFEFEKAVRTAGDSRVCQQCREIAGNGPYLVSTVRNDQSLIPPFHARCRCFLVTVPIGDGEAHPKIGFGVRRRVAPSA